MMVDGNQRGGRLETDGEGGDVDDTDGAPGQEDGDDKNAENTCPR